MKIIVGITGASATKLALGFIDKLIELNAKVYVIFSNSAKQVLLLEEQLTIKDLQKDNLIIYDNSNLAANISSGSFIVYATCIIPCSSNTLAKIACGINDNLITRVAHIALKEQRKLLLSPREMPFNPIMLKNMLRLSKLGAIISPPVIARYSRAETMEELERFMYGKWLDSLGIDNIYNRWEGA